MDSELASTDSDGTSDASSADGPDQGFSLSKETYDYGISRHNQKDRRLAKVKFTFADTQQSENPIDAQGLHFVGEDMDPSQHLEYYGERLVCQLLRYQLGNVFDPEVHWTSSLGSELAFPPSRAPAFSRLLL
jgi:hypothetical protein